MSQKPSIFITEEEKLKLHLQTTHTERFRMLMALIRLSKKLQDAKIIPAEELSSTKQKIPAITGIKNKIY